MAAATFRTSVSSNLLVRRCILANYRFYARTWTPQRSDKCFVHAARAPVPHTIRALQRGSRSKRDENASTANASGAGATPCFFEN